MATCDHPSNLAYRIRYPNVQQPGSRIDARIAPPAREENTLPSNSSVKGSDLGNIVYFIERRPRNPWATFGSFTLLSLAVLALIVVPLLHTDPLPKRQTLTMLYLQPPSAAIGNATRFQAPRPVSAYTPTSSAITAPVNKTQEAPVSTMESVVGGVPGGVPGGVAGGIPGGGFDETLSGTRTTPLPVKAFDPAPVKRIRVASRIVEANLIHDVAPQYPPEAGRARIEGTVVLLAVIGTDGSVKDVRVENGLPILAQAAIDAVKQWRYKPYMIDGEPVEVDSRITINFTLSRA